MSRRNASRFVAVTIGALASVLIWANFANIGASAAEHAHQASMESWGEPIQGTVDAPDDLEIRASRIGPYKEVVVTFTSRITHTYRQFYPNMLIKDIPTDKQIRVWEKFSTGDEAAGNTIDRYFTTVNPDPFDDGYDSRSNFRFLGLMAILAIMAALVVWWNQYPSET